MRVMGIRPANFRLDLSILELGRGTRQTDGQTDIANHFIMPRPYGGRGILTSFDK